MSLKYMVASPAYRADNPINIWAAVVYNS